MIIEEELRKITNILGNSKEVIENFTKGYEAAKKPLEKTFEEQFPELKGKTYHSDLDESGTEETMYQTTDKSIGEWIRLTDIQKHCKSNQRIRETIKKWCSHWERSTQQGNITYNNKTMSRELLKELGLEEKQ